MRVTKLAKMQRMTEQTQESRTMTVGAKVTPREYHAIAWMAGMKGTDMSNLLREMAITPLMEEHARMTAEAA